MKCLGILAVAVGAVAATGPASAQDAYNWTGFYIGGNVGYGFGQVDSDLTTAPTAAGGGGPTTMRSSSLNLNGILGGGQAGFNWQASDAFVLGVEADFQFTDQRKSLFNIDRASAVSAGFAPGQAIVTNFEQKLQWFGTVRGRLGYLPAPSWLVYATGGFAYGKVDTNLTSVDPDGDAVTANWSENRTGWVAGAGVEGAIAGNWTWKAEYLHVDLGRGSATNSAVTGTGGGLFLAAGTVVANTAINTRLTDEIVRFGVNFRF